MEIHKPPFYLNEIKMEVTHACVLRCKHCSSLAFDKCLRQMDWDECHRVLSEAAKMGVKEVAFSGGEPLLWKPLQDAVSFASGNGMNVFLYTTGNAPNAFDIFERLKASGLSRVMFSLYGPDKERHDAVTMVKGSFEMTLASVRKCLSFGLDVEFHFVPMPQNYGELTAVALLGRELGTSRVSVLRLVPQGRGADGQMQLGHDQNLELRDSIIELRNKGFDIRTGSPYNFLMLREKPQCRSGIDRLTISPDFNITPCDAFKQISSAHLGVSNNYSCLKKHSLTECWENSPYLKKVRDYLTTPFAEKCRGCSSLKKCLSGCMAQKYYAHGSLVKTPDPMCLAS